ncbi:MAG: hypothetical protein RL095_852 [Verrucomicrobiota bacterium]|jgi:hypothetical protein
MHRITLSQLFHGKLFSIPDYQRSYAWDKRQWQDFTDDLESMLDPGSSGFHYTGTIVTFCPEKALTSYNRRDCQVHELVDGQQRMVTCCLALAALIHRLIALGASDYLRDIAELLHHQGRAKITLAGEAAPLFQELLTGRSHAAASGSHQQRLIDAQLYFRNWAESQDRDALEALFAAITNRLIFTHYQVDDECEIGMTFELMNARGKPLSTLELLKNYLLHWISRNTLEASERTYLAGEVNKAWCRVYGNIAKGKEDQLLACVWTLLCDHNPKSWKGYSSFKQDQILPLRPREASAREQAKRFLISFVAALSEMSLHYGRICTPELLTKSAGKIWLEKIHRAGNIANFLPLLISSQLRAESSPLHEKGHVEIIQALEAFSYRVYRLEGKRSNAGRSAFFRLARDLYTGKIDHAAARTAIDSLTRSYSPQARFELRLQPSQTHWYQERHLLKYTLFEYELFLLDTCAHGAPPRLAWIDLASESTLEHILPQNPATSSQWLKLWSEEARHQWQHDIGNLVLTRDNSSYRNFDFDRKKSGNPGYASSDIRQERDLRLFEDWTPETCEKRRQKIISWILQRWQVPEGELLTSSDEEDDNDE